MRVFALRLHTLATENALTINLLQVEINKLQFVFVFKLQVENHKLKAMFSDY
jgi:hypothetical protein